MGTEILKMCCCQFAKSEERKEPAKRVLTKHHFFRTLPKIHENFSLPAYDTLQEVYSSTAVLSCQL